MAHTTEGVDTWEMVVVHRLFRREFQLASSLVAGVAEGDRQRSELVGEYLSDLVDGLHHHHAAEDELLWPPLLERVGGLDDALVRRMETQHNAVARLVTRIAELLSAWRARAEVQTRDELAEAFDLMSVALDEHLADEENEVLPLVSRHITQAEWDALGKRGQQGLPKGAKGFVFLGGILEEATPEERAKFMRLLPAPVRLLWRLIGDRHHRRTMTRIRGVDGQRINGQRTEREQ